ncbi:MAG: ammonium transporter [Terrabacter sp.]|nr:ammonium transporter [Dermatophilaceae bacterium]NUS40493.1 ammonium transporter [Terrabacter sp.]NUO91428.1 ammonium transporter [Dermatophilaceae bacterium]NUQ32784.1 ammonium transporter [Dermatophilaceae bacterium]NUR16136.1 ammonium transporter [Dermatophilaceae bacterium]
MSALTYVTADAPFTDSGNTAWVLAAAALVLFMTPGLALFYGGMVRTKSVLNMMMMSFITMGTVGTAWILWGYSETFGNDVGGGLIGNPFEHFGLKGVLGAIYGFVPAAGGTPAAGGIPGGAFVAFQVVFAIIAVALVSGAIADRAKFVTWTVFTVIWATLVYFPAAHWVFAFNGFAAETGGWIANKAEGLFLGGAGAYDFAGGTAIHINAGVAGLALAILLRKRVGWPKEPMRPHNLTLVMIGAGILWFGWFGFNAGSALSAGTLASGVWVNTLGATCTAMLGWLITEKIRDGHATSLGAASGVVAGLVAITPACATVSPWGALVVGLAAGIGCALAVGLKFRFGFDDSLDVVGVHLVGGLIGTLLIGFLADATNSPTGTAGLKMNDGLFFGGGFGQLWAQTLGAVAVLIYSFVVTFAIGWVLHKTMGFTVSEEEEVSGIDLLEHAETAYDLGSFTGGSRSLPTSGIVAERTRQPVADEPSSKEGASA